jgi:hypothetical protein
MTSEIKGVWQLTTFMFLLIILFRGLENLYLEGADWPVVLQVSTNMLAVSAAIVIVMMPISILFSRWGKNSR